MARTNDGRATLAPSCPVFSGHAFAHFEAAAAGWPYRDEDRLGFDDVLAQIRAAALRIVVLRVPSAVRYGGLVKDASETLASRLPATWVELSGDQDISRARAVLAHLYPPDPLPAAPLQAGGLTGLSGISQAPEATRSVDEVLERAAAYVGRFEREFSSMLWHERYAQEDRVRRRFEASGGSFWTLAKRRTLQSELLFVWLPFDATWIAVRDVIAVDGKAVLIDRRRLPPLLAAPSLSVSHLRQLASENGRFNVGAIVHTFNEPTLALLFLDDNYRHRFTFAHRGDQSGENNRVQIYEFVERVTPTVIRDGDRDVPVRGIFWIDPDTGGIARTILEVLNPPERLQGRMTVEYGRHPRFEVLVPIQMRETYSSPDEQVTAHATYSDFRRFETGGRLIAPK